MAGAHLLLRWENTLKKILLFSPSIGTPGYLPPLILEKTTSLRKYVLQDLFHLLLIGSNVLLWWARQAQPCLRGTLGTYTGILWGQKQAASPYLFSSHVRLRVLSDRKQKLPLEMAGDHCSL